MRCDIASVCEDHIRLAVDQANRQLWETLSLSFCISVIKGDVFPFNVTEAPKLSRNGPIGSISGELKSKTPMLCAEPAHALAAQMS
jgi:hypothetical protein